MDRSLVRLGRWAAFLMAGASLAACASVTPPTARYPARIADLARKAPSSAGPTSYKTGEPYQVGGIWYVPHEQPDYDETGVASWYGPAFNLKATADGEIFDMNGLSAAHTTLPLPSMVEVTNLDNGKKLVVRVNDRGPFVGGRIIDLSYGAAQQLGYAEKGLAKVRVRYVGPAPLAGPDAGQRFADAAPRPSLPRPSVQPDVRTQLASNDVTTPRFGFHTPLPTRLPVGAAATPIAAAAKAPVYAAARIAPSSAAAAAPLAADDDVVLTSYKPPAPVGVTTLASLPAAAKPTTGAPAAAPLTGSELGAPRPPRIDPPRPAGTPASVAQGFRIQAGAFSDEDRARRAAAQLAPAGAATVEPFDRNGVTLYRVFVPGPTDEVAAYGLRDKVAAAGFADARVVKPGAF